MAHMVIILMHGAICASRDRRFPCFLAFLSLGGLDPDGGLITVEQDVRDAI